MSDLIQHVGWALWLIDTQSIRSGLDDDTKPGPGKTQVLRETSKLPTCQRAGENHYKTHREREIRLLIIWLIDLSNSLIATLWIYQSIHFQYLHSSLTVFVSLISWFRKNATLDSHSTWISWLETQVWSQSTLKSVSQRQSQVKKLFTRHAQWCDA